MLAPQCLAHTQATDDRRHLTLAVNDARRRQLYFALYDGGTVADGVGQSPITLIDMDIDYPDSITMRVNDVLTKLADTGKPYVVDVIGHGAVKYAQSWNAIASSAKSTTMLCSTKARKDWRDSRPSPPANRRWQNRPRRTVISASSGRVSAQPAQACAQPCRRRTNGVTARP